MFSKSRKTRFLNKNTKSLIYWLLISDIAYFKPYLLNKFIKNVILS